MTDFFSKMNDEYAQKHFPDGSIFGSALKTVKRRSIGGFVCFGLFLAAALCGLVWGIGRTLQFVADGQEDMLSVGIVICGFFGVVILVCLFILFFLLKGSRQKLPECETELEQPGNVRFNTNLIVGFCAAWFGMCYTLLYGL